MEITEGIYALPVGRGEFMGLFPPNVYLVAAGKTALIDSGYGDETSVKVRLNMLQGYTLSYIFVTHAHRDHMGGALAIKKATGAQILLHPLETEEVDRLVTDGERIELGGMSLEIIHTPGHSPGHVCFWLPEKGILFSGDHILGLGTTVISPPRGDMGQYMASLNKLLNYPIELICPGHGPLIKDPHSKIRELLRHRYQREEQILSCLQHGVRDIWGMVKEIYPELDPRLKEMAYNQVQAHLLKLEKEGKVGPERVFP